MIKTIFNDFIQNIDQYDYTYSLYSKCRPIKKEGFQYVIGVDQIKDALENLSFQSKNLDISVCIKAINYYIENDAFIDLENPDNHPEGGYKIWGK
jgi:hypothetical protein